MPRFGRPHGSIQARIADLLGRQLLALWDGALSNAFIEGDVAPIAAARAAAARLLSSTA